VDNEDGIINFVNNRRPDALAFDDHPASFRVVTNGGRDFAVATESTTLDGEAPLEARFIVLAGGESPLEPKWTSVTGWRITFPLIPGDNRLDLIALDEQGTPIGSTAITVTSTVSWQAPSLSAVEPTTGPEGGGTAVTIRGADFHRGAVVRFGSVAATVDSIAAGEIHARTPAGTGTVPVSVTNLDGKSASLPAAFTYTRPTFVRGDVDGDGEVTISDAIAALEHLFRGRALDCQSAADSNDDGGLDLRDPIRLLFRLFASGSPLPPPGPGPGADPTPDSLPCSRGGA
jgi:hypothetical protein